MLKARYCKYELQFKQPAITSRSVMTRKETYFIKIWDEESPGIYGIGECALFRGLSSDDTPYYEKVLARACDTINEVDVRILQGFSSIRFGIETALRDLHGGGRRMIYDTPWSHGDSVIEINGLVWMGTEDEMLSRIDEKITAGFRCIKLKVGGIDFDRELTLIKHIRGSFSPEELELRLDANCAFTPANAMSRLEALAPYSIHSIEQPLPVRSWVETARLCMMSPIPIALDEELIGVNITARKRQLLEVYRPQYIILKPSLCGGLTGAYEWIELAREMNVGWWITSALESNIGLNAIAQFASSFDLEMPQGLGTGNLYTNNIPSPLTQESDYLKYDTSKEWHLSNLF